MKTELFQLAPGLMDAISDEEVLATCNALREIDAYHLPYPEITIRVCARDVMRVTKDKIAETEAALKHQCFTREEGDQAMYDDQGRPLSKELFLDVTIREQPFSAVSVIAYNAVTGFTLDISDRARVNGRLLFKVRERDTEWKSVEDREECEAMRTSWSDLIVALLATRNSVKNRSEDKLAKLGIGKKKYKHRYRYTTTISLPDPEDMEADTEHPPTGRTVAPHLRRGHIRRQHFGPQRAFVKRIFIEPVFVNADPDFVSTREAYNFSRPTGEIRP